MQTCLLGYFDTLAGHIDTYINVPRVLVYQSTPTDIFIKLTIINKTTELI